MRLERQKTPSSEIGSKARREELRLIERLLESGESEGVIGRRARASLQRVPSGVYWAGLKRLQICQFDGSPESYHRSVDRFYQRQRMTVRTDDGERVGGGRENWHSRTPEPPQDWPTKATFTLTQSQAEFLKDQIAFAAGASLLSHLTRAGDTPADVEFPWAHPYYSSFSEQIRWQLEHARNISEVMHGAALLYNLMLAELTNSDELTTDYRERIGKWAGMVRDRIGPLRDWSREEAWRCLQSEGARIPVPTREFVEKWCQLSLSDDPQALADSQNARTLVAQRERRLKGPLARVENKRAQELWQGASSAGRLSYRWPNADVIIHDIVEALNGRPNA